MDNNAGKLYNLNKRALEYRNSREYFIGERIERYMKLIRKLHFIEFFTLFAEDIWRVLVKNKRNPDVEFGDFSDEYQGEKIAVYTAIYGNYDSIMEPLYVDNNCDYYIFTDADLPVGSAWKKINYKSFPKEVNTDFLKNRYLKIFPHNLFPNYKYSIYIDGNIQIVSAISLIAKRFDSKTGIAMHKHPSNKSLYEEVKYNVRLSKITKQEAKSILRLYKKSSMPKDYGMFECNVILREHNKQECIDIMESWWRHLFGGVRRDQLYFTYVLYLNEYCFEDVSLIGENINANPMFIRYEHK